MLKCHFIVTATKPPSRFATARPYPYSPITLNDFLYKKRLDLNLTQKQVAELLKTSVDTVKNWEANRGQISLPFRPKIIEFVGYCPYNAFLPLGLRIKERRENFGVSIRKLSSLLGVDPCTIASWERSDHQPSQRYIRVIKGFLKAPASDRFLVYKIQSSAQDEFINLSPIPQYVEYDAKWSIGSKIIAWRTSVGLSQRQLAKLAGICFQSICRWEKEQRVPKPKYLKLIVQVIISLTESL